MSETSDEKSKRNYLRLLKNHEWNYQHSLFYEDGADSKALLDEMIKFKQVLRRKCPGQPFLIRIQLLNKRTAYNPDGGLQAYLVILTTINARDALAGAAKVAMHAPCNILKKELTQERKARMASAIKSQKPHNLERFFGKQKINRFTLLNKSKLSLKHD
ncbi:hypothetical protein [Pseudomonas sp. XK-1]|uniref:hypothetical protein n=1 Tax=Pseudomonas sp. XK-1 TaxID=3136019 RepID=UPI003119CF66